MYIRIDGGQTLTRQTPKIFNVFNVMRTKPIFAPILWLTALVATTAAYAQPIVTNQPRTQFQWENKRVSLNIAATGTPPLAYQWQFNGADILDATNRTFVMSKVQLTNDGNYQVIIRDSSGISTSEVARVMVRAWPKPTGPTIPELARLDTNMQSVMLANAVPGASLAVVKDGRLVFARGYGFAEVETNERYQPDSLWRSDSLAKTITAATYMQLVEQGKANLDTPVLDILKLEPPNYPGAVFDPRWTNVTARMALLHTGGWDRYTLNVKDPLGAADFDPVLWPNQIAKDLNITRQVNRFDLIRWMLGKPMQFIPGTSSKYSNFGYEVVGSLIEQLSGLNYDVACQQLLARAGITRMQLAHLKRSDRRPGEVVYYFHPSITPAWLRDGGEPIPFDFDAPYASFPPQDDYYPIFNASGGWLVSAIDYARLVAALDGNAVYLDILSTETVAAMAAPSKWPGNAGGNVSLGWTDIFPSTGVWFRSGTGVASRSRAVKYKNGIIAVFNLNTYWLDSNGADTSHNIIWDPLAATLDATRQWPAHDLFTATLSYDAWRARHFSTIELADAHTSGDDADPDSDGLPNLLEYASGTDPRTPSDAPRLIASSRVPGGESGWLLTYRRLLLEHEVDYALEVSEDLETWTSFTGYAYEPGLNEDGTVTARINVTTTQNANTRFFRLRISRKPQ